MPVALHPNQISRYVLKAERGQPVNMQTKFLIRPLSPSAYFEIGRDAAEMARMIREDEARDAAPVVPILSESLEPSEEKGEAQAKTGGLPSRSVLSASTAFAAQIERLVRMGLGGWENFRDADGKDVPFAVGQDGNITADAMARLAWWDLKELSEAVMECNQMPADRLGN